MSGFDTLKGEDLYACASAAFRWGGGSRSCSDQQVGAVAVATADSIAAATTTTGAVAVATEDTIAVGTAGCKSQWQQPVAKSQ